jgi:hypothetical protein
MASTLGHISGYHLDPRYRQADGPAIDPASGFVPCILPQILGAVAGACVVLLIASDKAGVETTVVLERRASAPKVGPAEGGHTK